MPRAAHFEMPAPSSTLLLLLCCFTCADCLAPHIMFFLIDDLGWNDVSMHGAQDIPTPNIDNLAAEGVRLNSYYVNPVCSPTRASLMSGRSVIHHGISRPFPSGNDAEGLNLSYTLLPAHLKTSYNYSTYMVGKWHLGMKTADYLPSHRGFDRFFGYYSGVMDYWTHGMSGPYPQSGGLDLHEGGADFQAGEWPSGMLDDPIYNTTGDYSTLMFARKAAAWIGQHAQERPQKPMFMYFAFQGCHSGDNSFVQAPNVYMKRFEQLAPGETCGSWTVPLTGKCTKAAMRKSVAACVAVVDDAIGDVVTALKRAGMYEDTLIVLSTDNGGPTDGADNNNMNNFPLRGCKGGYFDGGMRAVGLIHGAGLKKTGYVSQHLHHVVDWVPTLLTAAKQGVLNDRTAHHDMTYAEGERHFLPGDGIDNWDALSTGTPSKRSEIIHVVQADGSVEQSHALRQGDMKILWHPGLSDCGATHFGWYPPPNRAPGYANFTIRCPNPPMVPDTCTEQKPCLFNISSDPCEHENLASKRPDLVKSMIATINEYREHTVLPWRNFAHENPAADPIKHGPDTDGYQGLYGPWLTRQQEKHFYPTNYAGPGYPSDRTISDGDASVRAFV
eukprot:TRINITY_DN21928_c0_g1_i1.p1 TRINITY_DN21928_c0_g1~~TRINITY_DN21928_c0_g1_i1.p1  ORF type:complete len:612 (-),score=58.97 TRINITY_DN21928_c0_g1_i1:378-2213(-)